MTGAPTVARERARSAGAQDHPDAGIEAAVRTLVDTLRPALGLGSIAVGVRTGDDAARARAFGAAGLAEGGAIHLGSPRFDPTSRAGRELVVHELAHVAQQVTTSEGRARPRSGDPEAEARALARAFVERGELWTPIEALSAEAPAADTGTATPTVTSPTPQPSPPPAAAAPRSSEAEAEVTDGNLRAELGRVVVRRHQAARRRLIDYLDGWWVDGGDVRGCLRILDPLPFLVARTLVHSLPTQRRLDLSAHLDDSHHRSYPKAAVAALGALAPILLNRIEAGNVRGMDIRGFGDVERRTAVRVLRGLRHVVLVELLAGERRAVFHPLITAGVPAGAETSAVREALGRERSAEVRERSLPSDPRVRAALMRARELLDEDRGSEDAVNALTSLAAVAPAAAAAATAPAPADQAPAAGPTRPEPPDPGDRLRHVVATLERDGLVERLLSRLPGNERRADGPHAAHLLVVLTAREPSRNLALIEDLLSYDIFDWAITDSEARYAYVLVRSLPLELQERWRRRDEGLWFQRLEENIPREDTVEGRYRGVGREAGVFDVRTVDAIQRDTDAAVREIDAAVQEGLSPLRAVEVLRRLLAIGRGGRSVGSRATAHVDTERQRLLRNVVRRLDTLGHLDRILDLLPDAYLYNEMWRSELLEIFAARDARHIERHVRSLLSYGLFDWAVTAREAWLAYQLVRSLPVADQARLEAEDPERWARIQSEMTSEMRASAAVTALAGRIAFETRDRLRDRLRDRRVWRADRATELRSLVIQLHALDDRRWVWLRSRDVRADQIAGLGDLVADLRLYDARRRPNFDPEQLYSTRPGEEGLFQVIGDIARLVLVGAEVLWLARESLTSRTLRVEDFDLEHLQWALGGDLGGARLRDRDEADAGTDTRSQEQRQRSNRVSVAIDPGHGAVRLRLPRLELAGFNRVFTGRSIRTGRVTLTDLDIVASFSDRGYERPVGAEAGFARADANDIVVADEGLPGGLLAASRLGLAPMQFKSGATGAEQLSEPTREGFVPIPVIGPFLQVLSHILHFTGTIPGLSSLGGLLTGPTTAGAGFAAEQFTSTVANQVVTPLAEGVVGLFTDGVFRPPRRVDERAADAVAMMRSLELRFGELTIQGLSFGGHQQVQSVTVRDVLIGAGRSRPTYLRTRIRSLERRIGLAAGDERTQLEAEKRVLERELGELRQLEIELDRLESRHRWDERSLDDSERSRMVELSNLLRQTAGGSVDIGSIAVTGLSGRVEAAGFDIGRIHAEGRMPSRSGEYLPDEELVRRFQRVTAGLSTADIVRGSEVTATVAAVQVRNERGRPAVTVRAAAIPTANEVRRQLLELPADERFAARRAELEAFVPRLERLAELERIPAEPMALSGELNPRWRTAAEELERARIRDDAERYFGVSVGTAAIGPVTARLVPEQLGLDVVAEQITATDIRRGTSRIGRIHGEDLAVGVALGAGETGGTVPHELREPLAEAGLPNARPAVRFGARTLTVEGVDTPTTTLTRLSVSGVSGRVVAEGDNLRIPDLVIASSEIGGLTYRSTDRVLYSRGTTRTGRVSADVLIHTGRVGSTAARRITGATVRTLRIARVDADRLGMNVTAPEPGWSVEATSGALVGVWVRDLRLDLSGRELTYEGRVGVEQLEALRFVVISRALEGDPTTISGQLDSPAIAAPAAGGVEVDLLRSGGRNIDLRDITLTEGLVETPSGTVRIRRAGIGGHLAQDPDGRIRFDRLGPMRIDVSQIDWRTEDGGHITSNGSTILDQVVVKGSWFSSGDHRELVLDELDIATITSDDLRYRSGVIDVRLGRFDEESPRRPDELSITGIEVRGLRWDETHGITAGTLATGAVQADLAGRVTEALHIRGSVGATSIGVTFMAGGRRLARVRGGGGDIQIGATPEADEHHMVFSGLDTGMIDIRPDRIDIGPEGTDGLLLPLLELDQLNWSGRGIRLEIPANEGAVTLIGIRARVRIDLHPEGHRGGRLRRIVLRALTIDRGLVEGLKIHLSDATLTLDRDQLSTLGRMELLPPAGETEGFVIEARQSGRGFDARGRFDMAGFRLPWVAADVGDFLTGNADIAADRLHVAFFGATGMRLDLTTPSITSIAAQIGGNARHRLFMIRPATEGSVPEYGISFTSITAVQGPGDDPPMDVTARGGVLTGLYYVNGDLGLQIGINRAQVVGDITHAVHTGSGVLPQLVITDAAFHLDVPTLLSRYQSAPDNSPAVLRVLASWRQIQEAIRPYHDVIASLNGSIFFDIRTADSVHRVRLAISDGAVAYRWLEPLLPFAVSFELEGEDLVVQAVDFYDVIRWNLPTGRERRLARRGRITIPRLLAPTQETRVETAERIAEAMSGPPGRLSIENIRATLNITNRREIPLRFPGGNEVVLAPNALVDLMAGGQIPGRTAAGAELPGRIGPISIRQARVSRTRLNFGSTELRTGEILVQGLTDASLTFTGLTPQVLSGRITRATATNLRWSRRRRSR